LFYSTGELKAPDSLQVLFMQGAAEILLVVLLVAHAGSSEASAKVIIIKTIII
jgi:hypothetical protein